MDLFQLFHAFRGMGLLLSGVGILGLVFLGGYRGRRW
jgi:hypothetical protein